MQSSKQNDMTTRPRRARSRSAALAALVLGSSIVGLNPANTTAEVITLSTGETLAVQILETRESTLLVSHAILGELEIARSEISHIAPDPMDDGDKKASLRDALEKSNTPVDGSGEEGQAPLAEESVEKSPWKSSFLMGFSVQTGNTDTQSFNMGFTSVREWDRRKLALDGLYFLGYTDGDKDSNKLTTGALMNWEFEESKWSWFAKGRYDYDQFNSWESRVTAHTGPGYLLYDEENFNLTLRAGLGAAKEFGSKRNEWLPEALFGAEGKWTLSERQSLVFANWVFPELDESEFRNVTTAAWSYSLDDDSNWAINVGLLNEYQSNVSDDNENNDLRLFGGLSFDF